jgi:hypothetical protein
MSKILEQAARRLCPTCEGRGLVGNNPQDGPDPCPDCQDSNGQPTGLWVPELTVKCHCIAWIVPSECDSCYAGNLHKYCTRCGGLDRVLSLTTDHIDNAMGRLGCWSGEWILFAQNHPEQYRYRYEYEYANTGFAGGDDTREAARIAAAEAVVKSVWPEVEND